MIFDVTRLVGRFLKGRLPTGVDRVDIEYLRYFYHRATALIRYKGKWVFFSPKDSMIIFTLLIDHDVSQSFQIRKLFLKNYLNPFVKTPQPSLFFNISHSGLDDPKYREKIASYGLKAIYFIHDLIPITHPEYSRPTQESLHHQRMKTALMSGLGIIVNSLDTQKNLMEYADTHSLSLPNLLVAPLASAPLKRTDLASPLNKPFFVILGTIEARKNHWMILHVWRKMVETWGESTPSLVIVGQRGWESENVVDMLERCRAIHPYIIEKPFCSDAELVRYLSHARALLFPSFCEGYGMPMIESMTLGTPVIASDLEVFHQIAHDIPHYLSPINGDEWMNVIGEYAQEDSALREAQITRIGSFVPPTWENHFERVEEWIRKIEYS